MFLIKKILAKMIAVWVVQKQKRYTSHPIKYQQKIFRKLIQKGRKTQFGQDHHFGKIQNYQDFKKYVPIVHYESIIPYIQQIKNGQPNVLWPGKPLYLAKTSGTTAGDKYIPITKASIKNHIGCARNALLYYLHYSGKIDFLKGKMIFLSGSPSLEKKNNIFIGRLSGIVQHHVPIYLRKDHMPCYATNCIEDWEKKLDKISDEIGTDKMTLIAGIPPWIQMFLDRILAKGSKEKLRYLCLLVHGGVSFHPYEKKLRNTLPQAISMLETYPASEGFIAFQDQTDVPGLLLQVNSGIFYEFIDLENFRLNNNKRIPLSAVVKGVHYAIILNSNAGLWGYLLGDTVKFISLNPYRIIVTGRTKHFISAFGEHVIVEEIEQSMLYALKKFPEANLIEFTVAPYVSKDTNIKSCHEWCIAFAQQPHDLDQFSSTLSVHLQTLNSYYHDLIKDKILDHPKITLLQPDAFLLYMKQKGKLGGQNKVPRVANDRTIAEDLWPYRLK